MKHTPYSIHAARCTMKSTPEANFPLLPPPPEETKKGKKKKKRRSFPIRAWSSAALALLFFLPSALPRLFLFFLPLLPFSLFFFFFSLLSLLRTSPFLLFPTSL